MQWLILLCLFICGCSSHAVPVHPVYQPLVSSTVSIEALWSDGSTSFTATGVLVKQRQTNYLLTSGHVLSITKPENDLVGFLICSPIEVHDCVIAPTQDLDKDVTYADDDWAVLPLHAIPVNAQPLSKFASKPLIGESVYTAGFPSSLFMVNQGSVSAYQKTDEHTAYIVNVYTSPGSSGSPVVNTSNELIGIISAVKIDFALGQSAVMIVNHHIAVVTPIGSVSFE